MPMQVCPTCLFVLFDIVCRERETKSLAHLTRSHNASLTLPKEEERVEDDGGACRGGQP